MKAWRRSLVHVACGTLLVSGLPGIVSPVYAQQVAAETHDSTATDQKQKDFAPVMRAGNALKELPDSPGAILASLHPAKPQNAVEQQSSAAPPPSGAGQPSPSEAQGQPSPQKPVGTAAAEAPNVTGVAASQPAGVAMAPAKQHRVRTIILRVGAIIGAGVAVGSVVALTAATPSKPPGAR